MTLLNQITPDVVATLVRNNPELVLTVLQKFDTFRLFGKALSVENQILLSNNLDRVNEFLISEDGKVHINFLMDTFKEFVSKDKTEAVTTDM